MSESRTKSIGTAYNLGDAIALVRAQPDTGLSVIRVKSEAGCGDMVVGRQGTVIDAFIYNVTLSPEFALISLLSTSKAEYEVLCLGPHDSATYPRRSLNVKLPLPTMARQKSRPYLKLIIAAVLSAIPVVAGCIVFSKLQTSTSPSKLG
jgi:hypothetical protein